MRTCSSCSLCCKLLPIETDELTKPAGVWCRNKELGGCAIYATRPHGCSGFVCLWLAGRAAEHWRPDRSRMVLSGDGVKLSVHVDAGARGRWMEQPFKADIELWTAQLNRLGGRLVVFDGNRATVFEAGQLVEMAEQPSGNYEVIA